MKKQVLKQRLRVAVLSLLVMLVSSTAWADGVTTTSLGSGNCGMNANYEVILTVETITIGRQQKEIRTYSLKITGSGAMNDYSSSANVPWKSYVDMSSGSRVTIDLKTLITKVTISDDITTIGDYAFDGLSKVNKFELPSKLTTIGTNAFASTGIKSVYLPSTLTTINETAFSSCSALNFIQFDGDYDNSLTLSGLPASGRLITKYKELTFGTTHTNSISTPSGWVRYYHYDQCRGGAWVAYSGNKLYFYAKEAGKTVNLATSEFVTSADYGNAEYYPWMKKHTTITSLEIDKNISSIADYALDCSMYSNNDVSQYGFNSLETITVESGNLAYIVGEDGALYDKEKTTLVLYPAQSSATAMEIAETVTTVKDYALSGATNLTSLSFGENVSKIGKYVINNTSNLKSIAFESTVAPTCNSLAFYGHASSGTLYVPSTYNYSALIEKFPNWTVEDSAGKVGNITWSYADGVLTLEGTGEMPTNNAWDKYASTTTAIVFGEGITKVRENTFQSNYTNLQSVTIPSTMTEFGTGAFKDNRISSVNLTKVTKTNCLVKFAQITNVSALTKNLAQGGLTLSVNGQLLGENDRVAMPLFASENPEKEAIRYFNNIYNLSISTYNAQIPERYFAEWGYLRNVIIEESDYQDRNNLKSISKEAFNSSTIESIKIPSCIETVGENAFWSCRNLNFVELHDRTEIANGAFRYAEIQTMKIMFDKDILTADEGLRFASASETGKHPFGEAYVHNINLCHNSNDELLKDSYAIERWCAIPNLSYLAVESGRCAGGTKLLINNKEWDEEAFFTFPVSIKLNQVPTGAFKMFSNVKKIRFDGVSGDIAARSFEGYTYLNEVRIDGDISVGANAFANSGIEKLYIGTNQHTLDGTAFASCPIKELEVMNATLIGRTFQKSSTLEKVIIRGGEVAESAFYLCSNLKDVKILKGKLNQYSFWTCAKLNIVSVAAGVEVHAQAFASSEFETLNVLDSRLLGEYAWLNLKNNWTKGTLLFNGEPRKVLVLDYENILAGTLQDVRNVKYVVLTDNVKTVGEYALSAPNLEHITLYSVPAKTYQSQGPIIGANNVAERVILHATPDTYDLTYTCWGIIPEEHVVRDSGPVVLNRREDDANSESPIQLDVVNTNYPITWTTNGSPLVSVDDNGLVTINNDFEYNGTIDRIGKVIATSVDGSAEFTVEYIPTSVELTDGQPFINSKAADVESISYTRKYTQTMVDNKAWISICVPFAIDVEDYLGIVDFAELYAFCPVKDTNNDNVVNSDDDHYMVVQVMTTGKTIPGLPYVIRAKEARDYEFESADGCLATSKAGTVSFSTARKNFSITGLLEQSVIANVANQYYYVSSTGNISHRTEGSLEIKPNRWFMTIEDRNYGDVETEVNDTPNQAAFRIVALGENIDEETAIRLINGDYSTFNMNDYLYTIEGVRVTNTDNLPSGMYIKNGKKIFLHK